MCFVYSPVLSHLEITISMIDYNCTHDVSHSAGILLSPPAEAQQWEDNAQGDTTEQRGERRELDIAKQSEGKAGEESKTSLSIQD